jgi:tRNA nucleotidyltransferase (CCA-adding enzyme)
MKVYLVGGAVRDTLLGLEPKDRDYVVVGSTPEEMISLGYKQVGSSFPVFLHPETGDEYALARTERKTGPGYSGFTVNASPEVTLEEDLSRRDLTINAMAMDDDGTVIDPFGGRDDLSEGVLRHVSEAFKEDPVRILRVGRFLAQLSTPSQPWEVAHQTKQLAQEMASDGALQELTPERVWKELSKSLMSESPDRFFIWLDSIWGLKDLFPELDALIGVPQNPIHHPEVDTFVHTMLSLQQGRKLGADLPTMVAILLHDLGKGITPQSEWPKHFRHEDRGLPLVTAFCTRLKIPTDIRKLAENVCLQHLRCHRVLEMNPGKIYKLLQSIDGVRNPHKVVQFVTACKADARGRTGFEDREYAPGDFLLTVPELISKARVNDSKKHLVGVAYGEALMQARLRAIYPSLKEVRKKCDTRS